jgi:uncharacterized membrane protein (UPF0127 family)
MAQIMTRPHRLLLLLAIAAITPLLLSGCSKPSVIDGKMPVTLDGETFLCEIVADEATRTLGLGGRTGLEEGTGMLFSFPDSRLRNFVMRDCLFDIDIIFIDSAGRIVAMHAMTVEEPKRADESIYQYEMRLTKYSSRFNAQYVIELTGGTLERLDLNDGDAIELDTEYLQSITK